jgi:hypothetical protein
MSDTLNIFLSHKSEDAPTARGIKEQLIHLSEDDKLNVFLSEEILAGDDWFKWIRESLGDSNMLLLLFTDVTKSWDWCLYEAGLFEDLEADREEDPRRVVCLSGTAQIPKPLKHLQAVECKPQCVEKFLTDLFLGTELTGFDKPLSPWLERVPEVLGKAADSMSQLIARSPVKHRYFSKYVFIHVPDPSLMEPGVIPPDAKVEADESTLQTLFDKFEDDWTWQDLETEARKNRDQRWIDELAVAIHRFADGKPPRPMQATFRALGADEMYRPSLYRVDTLADGSTVFKVLFYEDVSWQLADIPDIIGNLLTSVSVATRFRYEVLEKYRDTIHTLDEAACARACKVIAQTISSIEGEADSRGLLEKSGLIAAFGSPAEQAEITEMYEHWYEIRDSLLVELKEQDATSVKDRLDSLYGVNRQYLDMATKRLARLMAENKDAAPKASSRLVQVS